MKKEEKLRMLKRNGLCSKEDTFSAEMNGFFFGGGTIS